MNKYTDKISALSMVKQASTKNEVRDTAVIGAIGTGTGIITNHIANKMGLNGEIVKAPKVAPKASFVNRAGGVLRNPVKSMSSVMASKGFRNGLKIGALSGAFGLAGDYAAVKINKALDKREREKNKYLQKAAEVQHYKGPAKTDKQLAKINLASGYTADLAAKLVPVPGLNSIATYGNHFRAGRDLTGAMREEGRAYVTGGLKGAGYALTAAAPAALVGAGVGKMLGNRRMAKALINTVGKGGEYVLKKTRDLSKGKFGNYKMHHILDAVATVYPEKVRSVLGHKHLGAYAGAGFGATAGVVGGGLVGAAKGNYDGRLTSIRNQINEGRLVGVKNTKN